MTRDSDSDYVKVQRNPMSSTLYGYFPSTAGRGCPAKCRTPIVLPICAYERHQSLIRVSADQVSGGNRQLTCRST